MVLSLTSCISPSLLFPNLYKHLETSAFHLKHRIPYILLKFIDMCIKIITTKRTFISIF
eukprot:UN24167